METDDMIIQVTKRWRIRTDDIQWIVERIVIPRKREGEPAEATISWSPMGYYPSLVSALEGLQKCRLRETPGEMTLREALREARRLYNELNELIIEHGGKVAL